MSTAGKSGSCIRFNSCGQDTFGMRMDVYAQATSQVLLSEVVLFYIRSLSLSTPIHIVKSDMIY